MRLHKLCLQCLALAAFIPLLEAEPLEQSIARKFIKDYQQNETRLAAIETELSSLPQPYLREPTGTGGFLSQEKELYTAKGEVTLTFTWKTPLELDAVALFPLRLFMDEIYGENLYWPGSITIEAESGSQTQVIAQGAGGQPLIPQSLPELIEFSPIVTRKLVIRCTDLPQHPHEKWHAAGFAEIGIFSGDDNVAPRGICEASTSRQGYHVLAQEFLTDGHTPLGIPELSSRTEIHDFVKKLGWEDQPPPRTYILNLTYPDEIPIDAVRIDPAIQHSYGQSFPVRFTIDLLDTQGRVIRSNKTYETFPLRNPGLNPHFSYFPETLTKSVRLTVLEASKPDLKAYAAIAFSEITSLHHGTETPRPAFIEELYQGKSLRITKSDLLDTEARQILASASDGLTQAGQVIPMRKWIEGLVSLQRLMEERMILQNTQEQSLNKVANTLIQGSLALFVLGIGGAAYLTARNRIRMRKEIRTTRVKIASDLHDDVGSNLGTIILHTERLQEQIDLPPEESRLNAIYRLTRESVFGLREVLNTTAPEVGRTQDLVTYMQELAALILGRTRCNFEASPAMSEKFSDHALRKGLLLFYKEALYNSKTHSGCSQIDISLRQNDGRIILQIIDNGIGIDEQKLKKPQTLRTLKQRAEWLNANLDIKSALGEGTELTLSIPQ